MSFDLIPMLLLIAKNMIDKIRAQAWQWQRHLYKRSSRGSNDQARA